MRVDLLLVAARVSLQFVFGPCERLGLLRVDAHAVFVRAGLQLLPQERRRESRSAPWFLCESNTGEGTRGRCSSLFGLRCSNSTAVFCPGREPVGPGFATHRKTDTHMNVARAVVGSHWFRQQRLQCPEHDNLWQQFQA